MPSPFPLFSSYYSFGCFFSGQQITSGPTWADLCCFFSSASFPFGAEPPSTQTRKDFLSGKPPSLRQSFLLSLNDRPLLF